MRCAECGQPTMKVLYMGFPGRLCWSNETQKGCVRLYGVAAFMLNFLPFNGWFIEYGEDTSYFEVLWAWLTGQIGEEE